MPNAFPALIAPPIGAHAEAANLAPWLQTAHTSIVSNSKREKPTVDPDQLPWHGKLWLRVRTDQGTRLFINWSRLAVYLLLLAVTGWLAGAGALWAFVKYKRGVETVRFVDVAFLPFRLPEYRQSLGRHYFSVAQQQLEAGAWTKALFNLRQAVGKDPHHHAARRELAVLFARMQRPDLAQRLLEDGLTEGRQHPDYLALLFDLLEKTNQPERIVTLGRQILPDRPDGSEHHQAVARKVITAMLALGAHTEAKTMADTWFGQNPIEHGLLNARIDQAAGYGELALMQLEALHRSNPVDERLALQLINLYQLNGRPQDARRIAAIRLLHRPDSPGAACDLIALLLETGEEAAAQKELEGYFSRFARDERALLLLSQSAVRLKQPGLARQVRQQAPRDEYGRTSVFFLLAEMHTECQADNFAAALALADEFARYDPLPPPLEGQLFLLRTWAGFAAGLHADAEADLMRFLSLRYPDNGRDALSLAARLQAIRAHDPARRILQTLLERNPDDRPALLALVDHDIRQEAWPELSRRVPQLLALDPLPVSLLQTLWQQGQDRLVLPPDLRARLQNLAR